LGKSIEIERKQFGFRDEEVGVQLPMKALYDYENGKL
jgi:hypothetical protein